MLFNDSWWASQVTLGVNRANIQQEGNILWWAWKSLMYLKFVGKLFKWEKYQREQKLVQVITIERVTYESMSGQNSISMETSFLVMWIIPLIFSMKSKEAQLVLENVLQRTSKCTINCLLESYLKVFKSWMRF